MNLQYTTNLIGRQGRRIPVSIQVDRHRRPPLLSVVAFARGRAVPMGRYAVRDGRVERHDSPPEPSLRERIVLGIGAALGLLYTPTHEEVIVGLREAHNAFDLTQRPPNIEDFTEHPALTPEPTVTADDTYVAHLAAQEGAPPPEGILAHIRRENEEAQYGSLTPEEIERENDLMYVYLVESLDTPSMMGKQGYSHVELPHDPHLGGWPDQQ
ncbi:hypothetical protein [Thioalkalivibrio sp. ALgr3]|uniref:hypothetical protein n=1 Tax=Thioalkalivibrio sp. ALgr3 TaxID=1239292 RepID=UPI00037BE78E|nr:hypothetical protein [Thioalkalivibrio sp. ALgr3]